MARGCVRLMERNKKMKKNSLTQIIFYLHIFHILIAAIWFTQGEYDLVTFNMAMGIYFYLLYKNE